MIFRFTHVQERENMRIRVAGAFRHSNQQIFMKTKLTLFSDLGIIVLGVASLCWIGSVSAQNPRSYPPLKTGGSSSYGAPTPAPAASKAPNASKTASKLSVKDKTFMMNAAKGGMMEVEWGKLAAKNGQNADVKKFGNRMVTDHSKANDELMALAREEGVTLPAEKATGKWKSDKDYMDMMVKDHEKDLAEFQGEAKNGSDPDLKKFADKYSKVVQKHLELAKETQGKLK
jgi:putative membrane protein